MTIIERTFSPGHLAAEGHFPGNPIIPGAVLLAEVLRAIESDLGRGLHACHLKSAKFVHPVRPGDRVSIEYSGRGEDAIRFTCSAGGRAVLAGSYALPRSSGAENSDERDV